VGEIMAHAARARGVTGVVLDGVVRDSQALREGGWPVFAIGTHPQQCRKDGPAWIAQTVTVAGVRIRPGDIVIGDDDGVVVVPVERAVAVADAVVARMASESKRIAAIAAGAVSPQWLEETVRRVGVVRD
jgi:4-hydroxy-4-methyl-2-oxoglutarate aldolase